MTVPHQMELLAAGLQFNMQARVDREANQWLRRQGIDIPAVTNLAGPIIESRICALPGGLFSFAGNRPDCFTAFVHVVHDRDAETPIDLIAWTRDRPATVYRYFAYADCIAADQVGNPATYFGGQGLVLHDSPLNWLQHCCAGAMVLDVANFRHRLTTVPEKIEQVRLIGTTISRARDLARKLKPLPDRVSIFVPASETTVAA
jgi:hypothetical protein